MWFCFHSYVFPIDADLNDVSSDEETEEDQASELIWPAGNIIGVFEVDPYLACPKSSCNNTKLITLRENNIELYYMVCKRCNTRCKTNSANTYLRATLLLRTKDGEEKKNNSFRSSHFENVGKQGSGFKHHF
ncbi:hypothetical protein KUTeg_009779 [Tegillarca granosa]|uniref:Uncharacterized protein n=1 Tax=Tegillarca granosa TaxID=220873 RepID=A0ABQ9F756_TEGGR|nr:hypothetical protein KUTeg_009779 [Tegillarca granosa]